MARGLAIAAAFLAYLTIASSKPTQFPHDKTLVYNYYGDVKAGIIEPAPYASQFAIAGQLHIKHDTSDPTLPYAYYVALKDVKTGMHNGVASHFQRTKIISPIPDAAKAIEQPFLIVNNEDGELEGVKIPENEAGWSKNMKMAIATMLQLDFTNMKMQLPLKHHNFMSKEKTIQGECWTSYDVHAKWPLTPENNNSIIVTKFTSPKNCTNYNVHVFDHVDAEQCNLPREAPVNMASRRVFEIENQGDNILIKSLVAHGGTNYFPLKGRSEAHYVLNNASFVLTKVVPLSKIHLPAVDFQKIPVINDLTYKRPETNYGIDGAVDVTQGRHVPNQNLSITMIKTMLNEAADYLDEHHLNAEEPNFKHGQTINRIVYSMGYMDTPSLNQLFTDITVDNPTDRDNVIKNLFIGIVSQVGTTASTIFVRDFILSQPHRVYDAIIMLSNLPLNVRNPNVQLLMEMEGLIKAGNDTERSVRKSSILCFASMVYRTFKNSPNPETNVTLQKYLNKFYDHLIHEPTYDMKVTYLNAIRNIEVGKIEEILGPIIRGAIKVSENPVHLRLMAIWAVKKAVANNYNVAHDLLWPIMADYNVPLKLRIAAYDILIRQAPTMTNILHIYWFMVYEKNEHLYNYHHTTIKGLANSVDPCNYQLRELTTKIMRFTKIHTPVSYALSSSYMVDSMDDIYGHGEKFVWSTTLSEVTGTPEVINMEWISIVGRKPVSDLTIQLQVEGLDNVFSLIMADKLTMPSDLKDKNVLNVLKKAAHDMPLKKKLHIDLVVMRKGRVILTRHYTKDTLPSLDDEIKDLPEYLMTNDAITLMKQNVMYENLYEQQIISEMGLPVVMGTAIPHVLSLKLQTESTNPESTTINLNADMKLWRHGDYSMSIYNPLMDVWHSIKRSTAVDVSVPIKLIMNTDSDSMKFTFPLLPTKDGELTVGMKIHTKDITTVTEDEMNTLKSACPTCNHYEIVTNSAAVKKNIPYTSDLEDIGLKYTSTIFDCVNKISPNYLQREWLRSVITDRKNSWNNIFVDFILGQQLYMKNILLSPPMGSCGIIKKIEPSVIYNISHIDISFRIFNKEFAAIIETDNAFNRKEMNIRGSLKAIGALTNDTAVSWQMNVNVDSSEDHSDNRLKMQLTRITPDEQSLMICIDGQKTYSSVPEDKLKVGIARDETYGKLTMAMAYVNKENINTTVCPRDQSVITIAAKGLLSSEQKKLFMQASTEGACKNDIDNPLMKNPDDLIPRTANCIDETIRHTTLREYALDITYKQVPEYITFAMYILEDFLHVDALSNINYTSKHVEPGNIKINVQLPIRNDVADILVATPTYTYDIENLNIDTDLYEPRLNGFGADYEKHLWMVPLDNTRFSMGFLHSYTNDGSKICTLFPKIALTLDGGEVPYVISNHWTLATGNYLKKNFAIFVKNLDDKMAMKIYAEDNIIEMVPNDDGFQVTIDGEVKNENGTLYVPTTALFNHVAKITKTNRDITVELSEHLVMIIQTSTSVTIFVDDGLQGVIAGLCGHMTGDYKTNIPKDYRLNLD